VYILLQQLLQKASKLLDLALFIAALGSNITSVEAFSFSWSTNYLDSPNIKVYHITIMFTVTSHSDVNELRTECMQSNPIC
jgi:hypothetical protein